MRRSVGIGQKALDIDDAEVALLSFGRGLVRRLLFRVVDCSNVWPVPEQSCAGLQEHRRGVVEIRGMSISVV